MPGYFLNGFSFTEDLFELLISSHFLGERKEEQAIMYFYIRMNIKATPLYKGRKVLLFHKRKSVTLYSILDYLVIIYSLEVGVLKLPVKSNFIPFLLS